MTLDIDKYGFNGSITTSSIDKEKDMLASTIDGDFRRDKMKRRK